MLRKKKNKWISVQVWTYFWTECERTHANVFLVSIKIVAQMLFPLRSWVTQLSHTLKRAQLQPSPQSVKGDTTGLWTLWISPTCLHSAISLGFSWFISKNCHKPPGKSWFCFSGIFVSSHKQQLFSSLVSLSPYCCFLKINILHVTKLYFFLVFSTSGPSPNSFCSAYREWCPLEPWSVTMVFVSFLSNAIITLNSYGVREISKKEFPKVLLWISALCHSLMDSLADL